MDEPLEKTILEKAAKVGDLIKARFGGDPSATAKSGQDQTQTEGGTMKVTRSAGSGAPGEVRDGKLVDVKNLAAAAARQDLPPTDLLALARANDPHNEDNIPETIASAVAGTRTADLGDPMKEIKDQIHSKQHPAIEKAVTTDVNTQVTDKDPYKSLHAGVEIDAIVARAKAVIQGAKDITTAATEVKDHPGKGKVEGPINQPKATGEDADKDPQASAKTLGADRRKTILALIRERVMRAKVEGPANGPKAGDDAGRTPEESANSLGDGGGKEKLAEAKDRPVPPMPDSKRRYAPDADNRDEIAKDYWAKATSDEKRWDAESGKDRPLTKETQEKLPKLAEVRRGLITRLAGLAVLIAASDEAERLHLQRKQYSKDTPKDVDFEGAASRTEAEINKEHGAREKGTHTFSPMMSKLWAAYGPLKTAADTGYKGTVEVNKGDLKKQIAEMQTAVKGLDTGAEGADSQMQAMHSKIDTMQGNLEKASGVKIGAKGMEALARAVERLSVVRAALSDVNDLCKASHMELRFSAKEDFMGDDEPGEPKEPKEKKPEDKKGPPKGLPKGPPKDKPMGGVVDDTTTLVQDLGETVEDMEHAVAKLMDEMGIEPAPKAKGMEKIEPEHKGPPIPPKAEGLPSAPPAPPMGGEEGGLPKPPMMEASWKAQFTKVASEKDPAKADMLSSYWEVMQGDQTVLKASVGQLYPVKTAAEQAKAYAWCATKEYGKKLLAACKFDGVEKTAKLLGVTPLVKTAAGDAAKALDKKITDERAYFSKAFGSDAYAAELVKTHKAEVAKLNERLAAEKSRNDRMESDINMRARAERALRLANAALSKGLFAEERKASFIDTLMAGGEDSFKATEKIVSEFAPVAVAAAEGSEKKAEVTPRELLRQAAAGPGLKTAIVQKSSEAPFGGLQGQLEGMWRKPPTAQ